MLNVERQEGKESFCFFVVCNRTKVIVGLVWSREIFITWHDNALC